MSHRQNPRERLRAITTMLAAVCMFAIMDALLKHLTAHYGPMQLAFLRCAASLVFVLAAVQWRRSWTSVRPANPLLHLVRGALGTMMLGGFVYAVRRLNLAQTYSLFLCAPLLMTVLSVPLYGDHVPARRWLAIAVGLSGVLVMLHPWGGGFGGGGFASLAGTAAAAGACICYALSASAVRTLGRRNSTLSMVLWFLVLAGAGSGLLALADWRALVRSDWIWLVAVGASGSLGQLWLTDAFRRAPASVVGPFEYTAILWAFAIDWFFWSATPTASLVLGAGIVIASGVYIILDERRLAELALAPASPPP
jgi:drug/metabolite transporter (DMT)-like permease